MKKSILLLILLSLICNLSFSNNDYNFDDQKIIKEMEEILSKKEKTKTISLKYLIARDIEGLIVDKFDPEYILVNTKSNSFLIIDLASKVREIEKFIKKIDINIDNTFSEDEIELSKSETKIYEIKFMNVKNMYDQLNSRFRNTIITYEESDSTIYVTAKKSLIYEIEKTINKLDRKTQELITEVIPIYFRKIDLTENLVNLHFQPKTIAIDNNNKYLVITDTKKKLGKIKEFIETYDIKPPTILVEGTVLKVDKKKAKQIGISYKHSFQRADPDPEAISEGWNTSTGYVADFVKNELPNISYEFTTGTGKKFSVGMSALVNSGAAEVVLKPHITFVSGEEGVFEQNQNTYFGTSDTNELKTVSIGLTLRVNGIAVEVGQDNETGESKYKIILDKLRLTDGRREDNSNSTEIIFESSQIVDDGQLIIIGGAINKDVSDKREKIPLLGDIPIIGRLFSSRNRSENITETLALIKLTVVKDKKFYVEKASQFKRMKETRPIELGGESNDNIGVDSLGAAKWSSKIIYNKNGGFFNEIYNKVNEEEMEIVSINFKEKILLRLDISSEWENYDLIEELIKKDNEIRNILLGISKEYELSPYQVLVISRHNGIINDKIYSFYLDYIRKMK